MNFKNVDLKKDNVREYVAKPRKTFPAPSVQIGSFEKFEFKDDNKNKTPKVVVSFVGSETVPDLVTPFSGRQYCLNTFWLTDKNLNKLDNVYNPIVFFGKVAEQLGIFDEFVTKYKMATSNEEFIDVLETLFSGKEVAAVIAGERITKEDGQEVVFSHVNFYTICRPVDKIQELEDYVAKKGDALVPNKTTDNADQEVSTDEQPTVEVEEDNLPF